VICVVSLVQLGWSGGPPLYRDLNTSSTSEVRCTPLSPTPVGCELAPPLPTRDECFPVPTKVTPGVFLSSRSFRGLAGSFGDCVLTQPPSIFCTADVFVIILRSRPIFYRCAASLSPILAPGCCPATHYPALQRSHPRPRSDCSPFIDDTVNYVSS